MNITTLLHDYWYIPHETCIYRSITLFHYCYLTIIPLLLYKLYWRWNSHIDIRYNSISYTSIITSYIHSINVNYSLRVYSPWNTHTHIYIYGYITIIPLYIVYRTWNMVIIYYSYHQYIWTIFHSYVTRGYYIPLLDYSIIFNHRYH